MVKTALSLTFYGLAGWVALVLGVYCALGIGRILHPSDAQLFAIGIALVGAIAGALAELVGIVGKVQPPWLFRRACDAESRNWSRNPLKIKQRAGHSAFSTRDDLRSTFGRLLVLSSATRAARRTAHCAYAKTTQRMASSAGACRSTVDSRRPLDHEPPSMSLKERRCLGASRNACVARRSQAFTTRPAIYGP